MTDIEIAIQNLNRHSICLCKDGKHFTDNGRGISPMIRLIEENKDLCGYSVADVIVGKAAAMLFVKAGIAAVHGKVMSESGKTYLENHCIPCTHDILTKQIINRQGTDICPMEKAVAEIDDAETGYIALKSRLNELKKVMPE